jgi:hypothetical protein
VLSLDVLARGNNPAYGILITTLTNNAGIRLLPFDFDSFKPLGDAITDPNTVYATNQPVLAARNGRCLYTVGAHPNSTVKNPFVSITQWLALDSTHTPYPTPKLLDRVTPQHTHTHTHTHTHINIIIHMNK